MSGKLTLRPPSTLANKQAVAPDARVTREATALVQGVKRLTLDLPVSTHRRLKKLAADRGGSMKELILDALAEHIQRIVGAVLCFCVSVFAA